MTELKNPYKKPLPITERAKLCRLFMKQFHMFVPYTEYYSKNKKEVGRMYGCKVITND